MPTREIYWNISNYLYMYLFTFVALLVFGYGFYRRYRLWRLGTDFELRKDWWGRLLRMGREALGQSRVLKKKYPGVIHLLMYSGFVILFIGTVLIFIQEDISEPLFSFAFLKNTFYLFYSVTLDIFGLAAIIGILMASGRRYIARPAQLNRRKDDAIILGLFLLILIQGFVIEAARLAYFHPAWANWSPVGWELAKLFNAVGISTAGLLSLHRFFWWFHLLTALAFIAYMPYSKLIHIFTSPLNIFLATERKRGEISFLNLEEVETFGVSQINQFSWKDLLDLDSCTECGRCEAACPAHFTNKPLSPMRLILDLQKHLHESGTLLVGNGAGNEDNGSGKGQNMVGDVILDATLWSCTTCMACQEACPVRIEHVPKIIEMRRHLVLEEARMPVELSNTYKNLETNANPWGISSEDREKWAEGIQIPKMREVDGEVDYLFWIGCAGAFDNRSQKIVLSTIEILNAAKVSYAILGKEENCTGDPARRTGNEYLFQILAEQNVETLNRYKFKKIITICPHCFNTLGNEYPQLGGNYEVIHHTQLIAELLREGKLKVTGQLPKTITYHDSCYLGRHNGEYDAPRDILKAIPGVNLVEMPRNRSNGFCCGAGGGRMWLEESKPRVNQERAEEAAALNPDLIGTACPFCSVMLGDGINETGREGKLQSRDVAQILAEVIEKNPDQKS